MRPRRPPMGPGAMAFTSDGVPLHKAASEGAAQVAGIDPFNRHNGRGCYGRSAQVPVPVATSPRHIERYARAPGERGGAFLVAPSTGQW